MTCYSLGSDVAVLVGRTEHEGLEPIPNGVALAFCR